jgi:hypothetical protein
MMVSKNKVVAISRIYFQLRLKGIFKNPNSTVRLSLSKSFYIARKPTSRFRQAQPDRVFRDALKPMNRIGDLKSDVTQVVSA